MKTIILEDSEERCRKFRSEMPYAEIYNNAGACIAALDRNQEDLILYLDHDLGGETFVSSTEDNTGMAVVRHLEQHPEICSHIQNVCVHSCNGPAAQEMASRLHVLKIMVSKIPFILLWDKNI